MPVRSRLIICVCVCVSVCLWGLCQRTKCSCDETGLKALEEKRKCSKSCDFFPSAQSFSHLCCTRRPLDLCGTRHLSTRKSTLSNLMVCVAAAAEDSVSDWPRQDSISATCVLFTPSLLAESDVIFKAVRNGERICQDAFSLTSLNVVVDLRSSSSFCRCILHKSSS